jgi:hypothetical protein
MDAHEKLDKLLDAQQEMAVGLAKYNVLLDEHIKRTEALEDRTSHLESYIQDHILAMRIDLEKKVDRGYITWALGVVTALLVIATSLSAWFFRT